MSDLTDHLVELIERDRLYFEQHEAHRTVNPFTLEPGYVPTDPYPPGASEDDFAAFRARTGVDLPDDIKVWLRMTNGAAGFFGVDPDPQRRSIEGIWETVPDLRQEEWIPVGRDDFGNFYIRVVPKSGGRGGVFHVEATMIDELCYAVASDALHLAEFILEQDEARVSKETYGWPLNKSFVVSKDPEILNVENARFVWKD